RPAAGVPRLAFDARLLDAARTAGAEVRQAQVRSVEQRPDGVVVDGSVTGSVLVAADGAESVVRRALGVRPPRPDQVAIAIRGYAPEPPGTAGVQVVTTTARRWPAYAWSFPLGDGRANVGYGELVSSRVTRGGLLAGLSRLLPGVEP